MLYEYIQRLVRRFPRFDTPLRDRILGGGGFNQLKASAAKTPRTLAERLALCAAVFRDAGLPMVARITPFSRPAGLDTALAALGWTAQDDTRVMVAPACPAVFRRPWSPQQPLTSSWRSPPG